MKLQQVIEGLVGVKHLSKLSWFEIEKILLDNGFSEIGKGSSAKVFSHPTKDFIYKVFDNDNAYSAYIQYCLQHQENPHIPRIVKQPKEFKKFFKHADKQNTFTVIRLERLHHLDGDLKDFYNVRLQYNIVMYRKFGAQQLFRDHYDDTKYYRGITQYLNAYPQFQFKQVFETLIDVFNTIGYFPDISPSNFMQRQDNTVVIIDPVAEEELVRDSMFKDELTHI